ncbi:MAG: sigma-54 interaction domain-containing protein, partial [Mailhella sp.]
KTVFNFDYIMTMDPGIFKSRNYTIYPAYKGRNYFTYAYNPEQDLIVLNSYHDTLVRICSKDDYGTTTITALHQFMSESHREKFSIIFLRVVVQERFIVLLALVSFKKDAYNESDATALFEFTSALKIFCEKIAHSGEKACIPPHNSEFMSLINLPGMQKVLQTLYPVIKEDIPVLLLGETGTGKEGIANLIYHSSGRNGRPFIKINCGGIPFSLVESKLFGYQKGAFTGADKDTPGCFELADTGVLMLDELGELPLAVQTHLLRVLQEGTIERVGSSLEIPVNVRLIAATNKNIMAMTEEKKFRRDLLYRLSVFPIYIPALRERPEDIPVLLNFFILQQSRKHGYVEPPKITPTEMRKLSSYSWPGNIREMLNAVTRAMLLWNGKRGTFCIEVGRNLFEGMFAMPPQEKCVPLSAESTPELLRLEDVEKAHIIKVLKMTGGRVTGKGGAAELMDINSSTLRARMRKLGILRKASYEP